MSTADPSSALLLPPESGPLAIPRADVVGIDLAITDYERTMDWLDDVVRTRARACVTAAAVPLVMVAREDPATRAAIDGALVVPDGVPLVWALRALGHADATRVYGPDLMARYCERSARTGTSMYLYGGRSDEALAQLTAALLGRFPGLRIAGGGAPPFPELRGRERDDVAGRINPTGAGGVWGGVGQAQAGEWKGGKRRPPEG